MTRRDAVHRAKPILKGAALVAVGMALAGTLALGDLWLDNGRIFGAALGREELARTCTASLGRRLAEQGFEPADIEFGDAPNYGPPWERQRSLGSSFTFVDGAGQDRVDGVMACLVSGDKVTVEFRVGSTPHRAA